MNNTMDATDGAGTAYPSGALEFAFFTIVDVSFLLIHVIKI
jgi:hypothetical protein